MAGYVFAKEGALSLVQQHLSAASGG